MKTYSRYLSIFEDILKDRGLDGYIVGGCLRDIFLQKQFSDIDIVINKRVEETARYFADKLAGSFVILDRARKIYRVIKDNFSFDISAFKGSDIEEDLLNRDFTINAMAYPLGNDVERDIINLYQFSGKLAIGNIEEQGTIESIDSLIDPLGGLKDLQVSIIRAVQPNAFLDDPLRLWRAIRLMAQLNFKIDSGTEDIMKEAGKLAAAPAKERIREEFIKTLKYSHSSAVIKYMEKEFNLLSTLIPELGTMKDTGENKYHREDAWTHSLQVLEKLEDILENEKYRKAVEGVIVKEKFYLLKLTALLHDIGKIETRVRKGEKIHYYGHEKAGSQMVSSILKSLKYSNDEVSFIKQIILYHMRPMLLFIAKNLTDKGRYRFLKQVGNLTPVVLIHSLADKVAAMEENKKEDVIKKYKIFIEDILTLYYDYKSKTEELYLSGRELKEILDIKEGPRVGFLLDKLADAQAVGRVKNREEALKYIKSIKD